MPSLDWFQVDWARGICHNRPEDHDPKAWVEIWFPERGGRGNRDVARAKAYCQICPIQQDCLEAGLRERYGIWGGHTERERRPLARRRRLGALGKAT